MKDIYSTFDTDELWLVKEHEWARKLQSIREAQFTIGNGYLGARGVLEEIPYDASPGTYIAGIYDKMAAQVSELVNLPNPVNFKFTVEGEKLGLAAMDCLGHKRVLNMKKGVVARDTLYRDTKKRRYDYKSLKFLSMHNKNIGVLKITLTPLDGDCLLDINTGIDTSVSNAGVLSEGRKKHFRVKELGQAHRAGYLVADTFEKKFTIVYWGGFYYRINRQKVFAKDNIFQLRLKKNQTAVFTKIFCIKHFPYCEQAAKCKNETFRIFNKEFHRDIAAVISDHTGDWEKLWKKADIVVEGTASLQKTLRFNIYHMLICGHYDHGFSSIGARTLSGEGYRGHIFWDAEIFLMPFYLFNFPRIAKNMLLYRWRRMGAARALAKRGRYKGVRFAWESADTGEEETPEWAKDIDGTIIKIHTHNREYHITADIAYAVYKYYVATGDEQFMEHCGYEMIFEIARFWASRVEYNKRKKRYEINNVIGPDEFHMGVNNNAYTNILAKWNLITAYKLFRRIKSKPPVYKTLKNKLNLKETEVKQWRAISSAMAINVRADKVIEQFDGYFKLKKVPLLRTDENGIPILPPALAPKDFGKSQIIKQADVLMILYVLDDVFSKKTKTANYDFYMSRTVHTSSLSAAIHSLAACEAGDLNKAYNLFNVSLRADISNLYGNTPEGIHAASLGGTWQAVIFGFAGVKIKKEKLLISPRMPRSWRRLIFSLFWQGDLVKLELTNEAVKIKVSSSQRENIQIGVFDKMVSLKTNKTYTLEEELPVGVRRKTVYNY